MKAYWIETFGCEMNKAESAALELVLLERGFCAADGPEGADLVLLNTCSVRRSAEDRVVGRLGFYRRLKQEKDLRLVLTGCMAQRLGTKIREEYGVVDFLIGTFHKEDFGRYVDTLDVGAGTAAALDSSGSEASPIFPAGDWVAEGEYVFSSLHHRRGEFRSYLPVIHGCDNFCTYCIVPFLRGREVSRSPHEVLAELAELDAAGVRELVLLGQNVNSYRWTDGKDDWDFPRLLSAAASKIPDARSLRWLRFLTSHPKDLSPSLVDALLSHRGICRHIHLPVQHGSDAVLRRMNRKYTRDSYLRLLESIRRRIPDVSFSSDILVGFPGETEQDFEDTVALVKEADFIEAFTYYFNPREGTAAASFPDQLDEGLRKDRLSRIIEVQREITLRHKKRRLGTRTTVLVEERAPRNPEEWLARTEHNEMVVFRGGPESPGTFLDVELVELRGNTFRGHPLGFGSEQGTVSKFSRSADH